MMHMLVCCHVGAVQQQLLLLLIRTFVLIFPIVHQYHVHHTLKLIVIVTVATIVIITIVALAIDSSLLCCSPLNACFRLVNCLMILLLLLLS